MRRNQESFQKLGPAVSPASSAWIARTSSLILALVKLCMKDFRVSDEFRSSEWRVQYDVLERLDARSVC